VLASLQETCPPPTNQWGFLPERSTSGALLAATHDWLTELHKGNEVAAVFFDIKKSFDSVPHRLLLHKLQGHGIDAYLLRWISGYLTDRTQAVILNGTTSQSLPVLSGVSQGSILGPLLLIILMSDINSIPLGSKLVLYADDILLYHTIRSKEDYMALQKDVDALNSWSNDNYLKFNPTKCKFMMLSKKRGNSVPQHTLFLMGEPIGKVSSFNYLGVTISDDLTWSKHIQTISSKARRIIGMLYRQFYRYTSTHALLHLYKTLIRPHLECSLGPVPSQGHTTPGRGPEICR